MKFGACHCPSGQWQAKAKELDMDDGSLTRQPTWLLASARSHVGCFLRVPSVDRHTHTQANRQDNVSWTRPYAGVED